MIQALIIDNYLLLDKLLLDSRMRPRCGTGQIIDEKNFALIGLMPAATGGKIQIGRIIFRLNVMSVRVLMNYSRWGVAM